ncbi:hypothetical protein AVEN_95344-1 [Araneus ventricosus]|uniref:Uncharacterized protein n=1 Tax=Araneus ventricosus TaxID=182803 RepID=A0A4Y2EEW6_ARAVE|nr:hypothetical protein AVEN_95344-1 [Araneus ventricosus]
MIQCSSVVSQTCELAAEPQFTTPHDQSTHTEHYNQQQRGSYQMSLASLTSKSCEHPFPTYLKRFNIRNSDSCGCGDLGNPQTILQAACLQPHTT